jgi:ABC-type Fe3+-siderophore transport system permease subunit
LLLLAAMAISILLNIGLGAFRLDPRTIGSVIAWRIGDLVATAPGLGQVVAWLGDALARIGLLDDLQRLRDAMLVDVTTRQDSVVWYIRLPRALLAAVIGAGLAISGATLQGIFRNPLADPGIIGVSSGAAVGAVFTIVTGIAWFGIWTLPSVRS